MARDHERDSPFHRPSRTGLVLVVAVAALMVLLVPLPTSRDSVGSIGSNPTGPNPPAHPPSHPVAVDPQFAPTIVKSLHPTAFGKFGHSVAATSSEVVVGAPQESVTVGVYTSDVFAGAAYIENLTTGSMIKLTNSTPVFYGGFGNSVAAAGNLVLVGDDNASPYGPSSVNAGEVDLFNDNGKLLANYTSPNAQAEGFFGFSVAISGDYVIVGAPGESQSSTLFGCGNAYLINIQTGAIRMIFSPVPQAGGAFGSSVSISGNLAAVGAPGEMGGSYTRLRRCISVLGFDRQCDRVRRQPGPFPQCILRIVGSGRRLIDACRGAGCPLSFYFGSWRCCVRDQPEHPDNDSAVVPGPIQNGFFGGSVALDGVTALVGARNETSGGVLGGGDAYLFSEANGASITSNFNAPAWPHYAQFGSAVAEAGSTIVVGAPYNNAAGLTNAGLVYVFNQIPLTLKSPQRRV